MWLQKPGSTTEDYDVLCKQLSDKLDLPITFEGRYKWIAFLNSKVDMQTSVLNRYYGIFEDGTLKVRGIELRRHDTPPIVAQCQDKMLAVLSKAANTAQFYASIPTALETLGEYVSRIREENVPIEDLALVKSLTKNPDEYTNLVPQAIAARQVLREGGSVHPGQTLSYILTFDKSEVDDSRARSSQLANENTPYDKSWYEELLFSTAGNILMPVGFDKARLKRTF